MTRKSRLNKSLRQVSVVRCLARVKPPCIHSWIKGGFVSEQTVYSWRDERLPSTMLGLLKGFIDIVTEVILGNWWYSACVIDFWNLVHIEFRAATNAHFYVLRHKILRTCSHWTHSWRWSSIWRIVGDRSSTAFTIGGKMIWNTIAH